MAEDQAKIAAQAQIIEAAKANAVKTIRKTKKFGWNDAKTDFEWPK